MNSVYFVPCWYLSKDISQKNSSRLVLILVSSVNLNTVLLKLLRLKKENKALI